MALVLADRVQETTTSTGTGSVILLGAVTGYQTFAAIGNGNTCYYTIADQGGANWEVGIGTYTSSGTTLSRDTVLASSNAGALVDFTAGVKTVFVTYPSEKSVNLDSSGNVSPLGTIASGTWQATTVAVAYGGTGVTASSGANSVVLRDANQNILVNSVTQNLTKTVSAGGTTVLTLASSHFQVLTGTSAQTYQLPDATSLPTGSTWVFDNDSTQNLTIVDNASGAVDVVAPGGYATVFLEANGTVAGEWGRFGMLPNEVNWGTNSLDLGGTTIVTNGVWQGTPVASGYGGTGLTTFTAANNALYSTSSSALTAGTLPVLAGGTGVTTSTGSGNVVLSNSPTLVTPALGTPSSGNLSNCTGYPAGSISGTVAIANGGTGQTSASAAFNALSPVTSTGDLIVGNGVNSSTRLAIGTTGKVLTSNGTTVSWETPVAGGGTVTTTDFTATAGQTVFTVTYTIGSTEVYQNGVKLGIADFTATTGSTIVLATGATAGDIVEVVSFSSLNLYSTITYEDFSGDGSTTVFTMSSVPANSASLLVAISGVVQDPGTYTVSSTTLTFLTAPPSGSSNISVRYLGVASVGTVGSFSGGTTGLTPASATTGSIVLAGTLATTNGGTGLTSFTSGGAVYATSTSALTTGTLPVASGGTGVTTSTGTGANVQASKPSFTATIGVGGATAAASGSGITFPATQSASTDANTLDDYEEGTWTPIDASGAGLTFTVTSASYVKIGRSVTANAYLSYPATASGAVAIIGGFPFSSTASNNYFYGPARLGTPNAIGAMQLNTNSTECYMYATASTALTNANMSSSYVLFTITYLAAS